MKHLPLTDISVPIACTLDAVDRPARRALLEQMRANTTSVSLVDGGVCLTFDSASRSIFEDFSVAEKHCCEFFDFDLGRDRLRWTAPESAAELMGEIRDFFDHQVHEGPRPSK